jgi:hypothetical protein
VRRGSARAAGLRDMSMTLYSVMLPPELAIRVAAEAGLLDQVWRKDGVVDLVVQPPFVIETDDYRLEGRVVDSG